MMTIASDEDSCVAESLDSSTVLALQQYEVASGIALADAAVLHAMVTVVPLMGALIDLADPWRRSGKRPQRTPPLLWNNR
jgi:hypothetical protein